MSKRRTTKARDLAVARLERERKRKRKWWNKNKTKLNAQRRRVYAQTRALVEGEK